MRTAKREDAAEGSVAAYHAVDRVNFGQRYGLGTRLGQALPALALAMHEMIALRAQGRALRAAVLRRAGRPAAGEIGGRNRP